MTGAEAVVDVGRSTHMDFLAPNPLATLRGGNHERQYHLGGMVGDPTTCRQAPGPTFST